MYKESNNLMSKEMSEIIEKAGYIKRFEKDEMLYHQGEIATNFCYLKSGRVNVFMTSFDGMQKTLNTVNKGELLGEGAFFDKKPRVSSAKALTDCEVVIIDSETLFELISINPKIALVLLEILSDRIRSLTSQLNSMTFMQAYERIAACLAENCRGPLINLTHEEIAAAVGVSRITVSKILASLTAKGIIQTKYRHIVVKDREALKEVAKL